MKEILLTISVFFTATSFAQDLLNERIRKISEDKKSIFLDKGIFHSTKQKKAATLNAMRHSFTPKLGQERLVLDFVGNEAPKLYGYINGPGKKLYIDLFSTAINPQVGSFGSTKYVEKVDFYKFSDDSLSVEIAFKDKVSVDVFQLTKPGRFVVDIKK